MCVAIGLGWPGKEKKTETLPVFIPPTIAFLSSLPLPNVEMMSHQESEQTQSAPAVTSEQRAAWAQLQKDRDQLYEQVETLKRGHQDLRKFLLKAKRNNWIACILVVIFTALGWMLDASVWLRWCVLPITFFCCALLWFGGKLLDRLMQGKIANLSEFLQQTDAQIEKGRSLFKTDHPQSDQA